MRKIATPESKATERDRRALLMKEIERSGSSEGLKYFFQIALASHSKRGHAGPTRMRARFRSKLGAAPDSLAAMYLGSSANLRFAETIKRGIPVKAITALVDDHVLSLSEVVTHVLPRRTLDHRRRNNEPLNEPESERALRIARIIAIAEDTFANNEKASLWLRRPNRLLDGKTPLAMADTEPGARLVEDVLQRIAHGIAA